MYSFDNNTYDQGIDDFERLMKDFIAFKKGVYGTSNLKKEAMATGISTQQMNRKKDDFEFYMTEPINAYHEDKNEWMIQNPKKDCGCKPNKDEKHYSERKQEIMIDEDDEIMVLDKDIHLSWLLSNELNQKMHNYVLVVMDEYEYEGSPVFSHQIDKEFVAQIVDRVISKAILEIEEVEEICLEQQQDIWCRYRLLRASVEINVLHELYGCRRPRYRRVMKNCEKILW